jgi:peptidoglycan-associated lipoprotein
MGAIGLAVLLNGCATKQTATPAPTAPTAGEEAAPTAPTTETRPMISESEDMSAPKGLSDVYFDFDRDNIRDDMRAVLEGNAQWLRANPGVSVKIEGHCDERGTNEYNLALGERRAQAVKRFLTSAGIAAGRISTISYGEERPVCTAQSESCYAQNRRGHSVAK